jgi:hypothetical protein
MKMAKLIFPLECRVFLLLEVEIGKQLEVVVCCRVGVSH